jgi:hypothetical protein
MQADQGRIGMSFDICGHHDPVVTRAGRRKAFFSEEKKQKTFTSLSRFDPAAARERDSAELIAFTTSLVLIAQINDCGARLPLEG